MFSTDFIFRQQENLVDNQKSQVGYRPLRNKILFLTFQNSCLQTSEIFQLIESENLVQFNFYAKMTSIYLDIIIK